MKKNYSILIAVIVVVLVGGAYYVWSQQGGGYQSSSSNNGSGSGVMKFSDSPDAPYAYLISTDTYDAKTQEALSGFTVDKKTLSDGSMQITLNAQKAEYVTQTYTVKQGEQLYFIERSLGDDHGDSDGTLNDDHAILVDANGYIVQQSGQ